MATSLPQSKPRSKPSALLIGSATCNKDNEGKLIKGVIEKVGISTILKDGQQDMWVNVDLNNMEHLMGNKEIDVYQKFNYREQKDDYSFALGKVEITAKMTRFFSQEGRTRFVLYYSGHGDENGSWCFPRGKATTLQNGNTSTLASDTAAPEGHARIVSVEIHQPAGDDDEDGDGQTGDEGDGAYSRTPPDSVDAQGGSTGAKLDGIVPAAATSPYLNESLESLEAKREQPPPIIKTNDLLTFEEVINIW